MYELTFIINPNLSETDTASQMDKVRGFINQLGGSIENEKSIGKRRLSYPIKKQNFGFYASLEFNLTPENLSELEKQLKLEPQILRYLLILKDKVKAVRKAFRPIKIKEKIIPIQKITREIPKEKVKIEEIDKKLEEILEA